MGKVHGSLARAGKVKSQTPKVSDDVPFISVENSDLATSFAALLSGNAKDLRSCFDDDSKKEATSLGTKKK